MKKTKPLGVSSGLRAGFDRRQMDAAGRPRPGVWKALLQRLLPIARAYRHEHTGRPPGAVGRDGPGGKIRVSRSSRRDAYRLTATGKTLRPVLSSVAQWGLANIQGTKAIMKVTFE